MKTKMTFIKILLALPLTFLFTNCGKSGGGGPAVAGYYVSGGQCYISGSSSVAGPENCQTGSQYQLVNGTCMNTSGANVGLQYCNGGAAVSGFYIANGACYASGTTTQAAVANCQTGAQYTYQNGQCLTAQGAVAGNQFCMGNGINTGIGGINNGINTGIGGINNGIGGGGGLNTGLGGGGAGVCNGNFYIQTYGGYQPVQCSVYNFYCSGAIVYTSSGQAVRCQ